MSKKKCKSNDKKLHITLKNIAISLFIPVITFLVLLLFIPLNNDIVYIVAVILISASLIIQLVMNKSSFSHTVITLAICYVINVILLMIFGHFGELVYHLSSFIISYIPLYLVLAGIKDCIKKKNIGLLIFIILTGLVLFLFAILCIQNLGMNYST